MLSREFSAKAWLARTKRSSGDHQPAFAKATAGRLRIAIEREVLASRSA
jgi:hypothetical protein